MRRKRAESNRCLCDTLFNGGNCEKGKYNDWVVTTAFYSAIYFVDHEIFPREINGEEYENFNNYYVSLASPRSKHVERYLLTKRFLNHIAREFKELMDACESARYNLYHVTPEIAKQARIKLTIIENAIKKP